MEEQISFHAMLAHELRNPLVAVLSGLQALDRTPPSDVAQRVREVMHKEITHITRLIDDLLDTARVETGALTYKKRACTVEECINFAVAIVQPVIKNADQSLKVSNHAPSALLWADPNRIAQVISNLLHNASKFSPHGNTIAVCARVLNGEALIEISDQGRGIAIEDQGSIFETFSKGHQDTESSSSGLGLGLFVSREIIRAHSGTLELASSSPLGTTFRISLPTGGNDQDVHDKPQATSPTRERVTILLVDDNSSGLEATKLLLELEGHTVHAATSAQDGLRLFEQHSPTVAILDIGLPDINGRLLAKQLRERREGRPLLLIALTGRGSETDETLSLESGFDAHLIKPATIDELSERISRFSTSVA